MASSNVWRHSDKCDHLADAYYEPPCYVARVQLPNRGAPTDCDAKLSARQPISFQSLLCYDETNLSRGFLFKGGSSEAFLC
eukprot:3965855-Amphidinium_carterae.1